MKPKLAIQGIFAALIAICALSAAVSGATCTVNSMLDAGAGTGGVSGSGDLRYCIDQANAAAGADSITFAMSGTIGLMSSLPTITSPMTIDAAGRRIVVDGQDTAGITPIKISGANASVSLVGFIIKRGRSANPSGGGISVDGGATAELRNMTVDSCTTAAEGGGGIFSSGSMLRVIDSRITNNRLTAPGASGAGLSVTGGSLFVSGSLIDGNALQNPADRGGAGIELFSVGDARVENSTISNNRNGVYGAGIANNLGSLRLSNVTITGNSGGQNGGGVANVGGSLVVRNSTITGNSVTLRGGGIISNGNTGTATVANSIVSGNSAGIEGTDIFNFAALNFLGANILGTAVANSGSISGGANVNVTDPELLPCGSYGGPAATCPVTRTSPATNGGVVAEALDTSSNVLTTDGRGAGFPRFIGGMVDIGAVERPASQPTYMVSGRIVRGDRILRGSILLKSTDQQSGVITFVDVGPSGMFSFAAVDGRTYEIEVVCKSARFSPRSLNVIGDVRFFDLDDVQ